MSDTPTEVLTWENASFDQRLHWVEGSMLEWEKENIDKDREEFYRLQYHARRSRFLSDILELDIERRREIDRAHIWSMFPQAAADALATLGEEFAFDDPDSLSGAITRLIARASAPLQPIPTNE